MFHNLKENKVKPQKNSEMGNQKRRTFPHSNALEFAGAACLDHLPAGSKGALINQSKRQSGQKGKVQHKVQRKHKPSASWANCQEHLLQVDSIMYAGEDVGTCRCWIKGIKGH